MPPFFRSGFSGMRPTAKPFAMGVVSGSDVSDGT
jgi:hypothetical protein